MTFSLFNCLVASLKLKFLIVGPSGSLKDIIVALASWSGVKDSPSVLNFLALFRVALGKCLSCASLASLETDLSFCCIAYIKLLHFGFASRICMWSSSFLMLLIRFFMFMHSVSYVSCFILSLVISSNLLLSSIVYSSSMSVSSVALTPTLLW